MVDKNEETGIYEARSQWDAPEIDQIVFIFLKRIKPRGYCRCLYR